MPSFVQRGGRGACRLSLTASSRSRRSTLVASRSCRLGGGERKVFGGARPEAIFHLASHVKGAPDLEHVLPTFHSNLQSTVNLLTVAAESNCRRVVLTGSLAEPEVENGETFPSAPYAAAKWAGSGYARMFHALYKLPVVIARVFMVYGPGQIDLTKLIPYVTLSLLQGEIPQNHQWPASGGLDLCFGCGRWVFGARHKQPGMDGATIDLGSGSLVSIREIVQQLVSALGSGNGLKRSLEHCPTGRWNQPG